MERVGRKTAGTGKERNRRWANNNNKQYTIYLPRGMRNCGLVCYARALELLEEWGIQLNERGGFGGDFTGTGSDGADAGVAAATSKRRRAK